jgi:hypothetical protein
MTDENLTPDPSATQQVLDLTRQNSVLRAAVDDHEAADRRWSAALRDADATLSRLRTAAREASTAVRTALRQPNVEWSYQEQADLDESALDAVDALDEAIGGTK